MLPGVRARLGVMGIVSRLVRAAMLDELHADYVRTARAKGLERGRGDAPPRAAQRADPGDHDHGPARSASLLTSAVLTETVFSWNGIGSYAVEADPAPRLPGDQRRVHPRRRHLPARQPRRRRPLRRRRPEDPATRDHRRHRSPRRCVVPTRSRGGAWTTSGGRSARGRSSRRRRRARCCGCSSPSRSRCGRGPRRTESVGAAAAVAELVAPPRHRRPRPRRVPAHAVRRARVAPDGRRRDRAHRADRLRCSARSPASVGGLVESVDHARRATSCWRSRRSSWRWPSPPPSAPACATPCVALVLVWWPIYARLLRGQVLTIKHREHVEAAVSVGVPRGASCAGTCCRWPSRR